MTRLPREASIVRSILRYLRSRGDCVVEKRHGTAFGMGGVDLFGCLGGRHFELEVKRPGGRLTPRQDASLRRWREAGALVGVVSSVDDVRSWLQEERLIVPTTKAR